MNFSRPTIGTVRLCLTALLVGWCFYAGKDVSWDVVNHHFYLPFAWATGRIHTDLFGSSAQAYQNPIGYFPIYWLLRAGLPAYAIGVLLSLSHALVIWPLDRIGRLLWPGDGEEVFWTRTLALAFACAAPIFLIHVGTTSTDPITSLMVVWAVVLTLEAGLSTAPSEDGTRRPVVAGLLLGLASAIKLSNAIFAVALGVVWFAKWCSGQVRFGRLVAFCVCVIVALIVAAGPWMWFLWTTFGNPVFPLFNNVFHSPYAPQDAIETLRFVDRSAWGIVARLWQMAEYANFVAFEAFLPDLRPVLAAGFALIAAAVIAGRGGWHRAFSAATWRHPVVQLTVFVVLGYVLWLRSSGNARYAMPLFMLVGIVVPLAVKAVLPWRGAKIVLLTTLLLQLGNYQLLGSHRFAGIPWDGGPYLNYRVSERLRTQPFLHISIGTQSSAAAALFLAPDGALVNPIGQFALPTDGPLGDRLHALMDRWHGRTRLLFIKPPNMPGGNETLHEGVSALLYRLGIDVDWNDCEDVQLEAGLHDDRAWATVGGQQPDHERDNLSCGILYRHDRDPVADAQRIRAEKVFAKFEHDCPKVFTPVPMASEHNTGVWQRHYTNTEAELSASVKDGVSMSHYRMFTITKFGTIDDVLNRTTPIRCPQISFQTPR